MKTLKKVTITPVFVEWMPDFYEQGSIYISEPHRCAKHLCLCGCGQMVIMGLNEADFPNTHWGLIKNANGSISFRGSVGNYAFPCKSHYIITDNVANFI